MLGNGLEMCGDDWKCLEMDGDGWGVFGHAWT